MKEIETEDFRVRPGANILILRTVKWTLGGLRGSAVRFRDVAVQDDLCRPVRTALADQNLAPHSLRVVQDKAMRPASAGTATAGGIGGLVVLGLLGIVFRRDLVALAPERFWFRA
jgi:hypothetical protein